MRGSCGGREAASSPSERLEHFRHLGREMAFEERKRDKAAAAAEKKRWKKIHQAARRPTRTKGAFEPGRSLAVEIVAVTACYGSFA